MKYYAIDVGFFPIQVKLCFNKKAFAKVLSDYQITPPEDPKVLEMGIGETHCFQNAREMVVIVALNLDALDNSSPALVALIAHESTHVIARMLEGISEDEGKFGEETRAYLTEHLVRQMFIACVLEVEKIAKRKKARTKTGKKDQRAGGTVLEVDKPGDDGGSGQAGDNSWPRASGGGERQDG
jgi:hypothetical protein